jgi:hypothetical protein
MKKDETPPETVSPVVDAEPVTAAVDASRYAHLAERRGFIIKRVLFSTALSGAVPIPVLDDIVATRVRAGLYIRLARERQVDIPVAAAEVLAEAREGSRLRNATMTAASLIAIKLAWRKFFLFMAFGRGAEEAASLYQGALLFDHYCARLHRGAAIDRDRAALLRRVIHVCVAHSNKTAVTAVFRDGGKVLGRSLLQAPRWLGQRMASLAERWVQSRGNPDVAWDLERETASAEAGEGGMAATVAERRWLDRAARTVEDSLSNLGNDHVAAMVEKFEQAWLLAEDEAAKATQDAAASTNPRPS